MAFVCDASAALSWVLPGQTTAKSSRLFWRAASEDLFVPQLWHLEVADQIGIRRRLGKLTEQGVTKASELLAELSIVTDSRPPFSLTEVLDWMQRYELTAYDATYLELAARKQMRILTFDNKLISAAQRAGVAVLS